MHRDNSAAASVYAVVLAWSTVYITSYCSDPIALAHFYPIPEVSKTNKLMIHVALPRGRFKTHNQGSHDLFNAPGHLRRLYGTWKRYSNPPTSPLLYLPIPQHSHREGQKKRASSTHVLCFLFFRKAIGDGYMTLCLSKSTCPLYRCIKKRVSGGQ
jgi:hypothetical protein